ncbi:uncharacterized protein F5891DRAFT_1208242 [Suillus fuscotomentosus]|uniref:Uncharacterized protein n=1 Tax=Suillus fuscotomentosus TaxID=1912939 RepID=A0AAD4ED02_9AGAM|nr:uncharacterized protein F5891DRAFT_1208242 [Suillus fuscotomentosus]KAG1903766.1 hypothetical protein F5891DRAFT_1208242 [Suillus fuscotomentosus]
MGVADDESRSSGSLIGSASAIPGSTLAADDIHPPAHKLLTDVPTAGFTALENDAFIEEEGLKATSKKKAPPKPTPVVKLKHAKAKRFSHIVKMRMTHSRPPYQSSHLPEDEDSRCDGEFEIIAMPEITKVLTLTRILPEDSYQLALIQRVNSQPNSPFSNGPSYLPLVGSSRTMLSRIAPLHPNRGPLHYHYRDLPPLKKSKKQIEMEERIEEELRLLRGGRV